MADRYILTGKQLEENEFPGPAAVLRGFIRFDAPSGGAGCGARMLAIDCEMCQVPPWRQPRGK